MKKKLRSKISWHCPFKSGGKPPYSLFQKLKKFKNTSLKLKMLWLYAVMDTLDSTEFHRVRLRFSAVQDRVLLNSTLLSIEFNLTQRSVQDNALYRSGQRCPGQVQFDSALSRTEFILTRKCPGQSSVWLSAVQDKVQFDSELSWTEFSLTQPCTV